MNKLQRTIIANIQAGVCTPAVMLRKAQDAADRAESDQEYIDDGYALPFIAECLTKDIARNRKYAADVRAAVAAA